MNINDEPQTPAALTYWVGNFVGPRAGLGVFQKEQAVALSGIPTPDRPAGRRIKIPDYPRTSNAEMSWMLNRLTHSLLLESLDYYRSI